MIPFRLVVACSCGQPTFPRGCNSVTSFHTVHVSTWHAMNTVAPLSLRRYCWLTSGQCTASTARDQHSSSSTGFGQPRVARQEIELRARAAFTPVTVTVRNEVKLWGTKAQKKITVQNDIVGTPAPLPQQPSAVGIMLCVVSGGRCSLSRLVPSTAPLRLCYYARVLCSLYRKQRPRDLPTSNDQSVTVRRT